MRFADRMRSILDEGSIPYKEVNVFGARGIVTCWSLEAANRLVLMLKAATFNVRGPVESVDYNKDQSKRTTLQRARIRVWRVGFVASKGPGD